MCRARVWSAVRADCVCVCAPACVLRVLYVACVFERVFVCRVCVCVRMRPLRARVQRSGREALGCASCIFALFTSSLLYLLARWFIYLFIIIIICVQGLRHG